MFDTALSKTKVESLVWQQISTCADEIAGSTQINTEIAFSSSFVPEGQEWQVQAVSLAMDLNLGLWDVADQTGLVTPADDIAANIASREFVCSQPRAFLAGGKTPPSFAIPTPTGIPTLTPEPPPTPTPTPAPTQTPVLIIANGDQAAVSVWLAVINCFTPKPAAKDFNSYQDRNGRWIVEGKGEFEPITNGTSDVKVKETNFYGLWAVDSASGRIAPLDSLARFTERRASCYQNP